MGIRLDKGMEQDEAESISRDQGFRGGVVPRYYTLIVYALMLMAWYGMLWYGMDIQTGKDMDLAPHTPPG
jgi:hypothetical protein